MEVVYVLLGKRISNNMIIYKKSKFYLGTQMDINEIGGGYDTYGEGNGFGWEI
jgi:hypothetical protein